MNVPYALNYIHIPTMLGLEADTYNKPPPYYSLFTSPQVLI